MGLLAALHTRQLRPVINLYRRLRAGLTIGVRAVVISDDGSVLLIRHRYEPGWRFPGGGVERGETVEDALRRELLEEARIEMMGPPHMHGVFLNRKVSTRDHVFVFVVREFRVLDSKQPDLEIAACEFFGPGSLPEHLELGTARRLAEINGQQPLSQDW